MVRDGGALLPGPAIHGAVMSLVSGGIRSRDHVYWSLPGQWRADTCPGIAPHTHSHSYSALNMNMIHDFITKGSKGVLCGAAVGKDLGDSVGFA